MPTAKPRITITLEPHRHELLRRLAACQGGTMSAIVTDLVDSVAPVLERVCVSLENAQRAREGVKSNLRRMAEEAEKVCQPHVDEVLGQLDLLLSACDATADSAAASNGDAKEPAAAAAASDPRPVITGVRFPRTPHQKGGRQPRKGGRNHAL